jgi:hypothetical protein
VKKLSLADEPWDDDDGLEPGVADLTFAQQSYI